MASFSERQQAPKLFSITLIILWFLAIIYFDLYIKGMTSKLIVWVGGSILVGFHSIVRLDSRYDAEGIHYRLFPFLGWRTIRWTDVQQATMITYNLGYGLRHVNEVYNGAVRLKGNNGLRIQKKNGRTILFGTEQPNELKAFLSSLPIGITA